MRIWRALSRDSGMKPELCNKLAQCSHTEEGQTRQISTLGKPNWATRRISHGAYTGHTVSNAGVSGHGKVCMGSVAIYWQPFIVEGCASLLAILTERKVRSQFHI